MEVFIRKFNLCWIYKELTALLLLPMIVYTSEGTVHVKAVSKQKKKITVDYSYVVCSLCFYKDKYLRRWKLELRHLKQFEEEILGYL